MGGFNPVRISRCHLSVELLVPGLYPAKTYFLRKVYQGEEWARESYDPCRGDCKYYDKEKYCWGGVRPFFPGIDDER